MFDDKVGGHIPITSNIHKMCGASIVNEKKLLYTFCKGSWSIWQRIAIYYE